jgi:hypothetical protein
MVLMSVTQRHDIRIFLRFLFSSLDSLELSWEKALKASAFGIQSIQNHLIP